MTSEPSRSEQKQRHAALADEIADLLLSAESPVRNQEAFQPFIEKHDRATARQVELDARDGKLAEVIAVIERAETQAAETQKQLATEKNVLTGFAGELGKAAFAGLQAGELDDHPLFADRKALQSQIDALKQQQAEQVVGENAGMLDKAKIKAQQIKFAGLIKAEELKIKSSNNALGLAIMQPQKSDLTKFIRCVNTEEILKAISYQQNQVRTASDNLNLAEQILAEQRNAVAEKLERHSVFDSATLKSELKEVRKEQRQTQKAIKDIRKLVLQNAMETQALRNDVLIAEKLYQLQGKKVDPVPPQKKELQQHSDRKAFPWKTLILGVIVLLWDLAMVRIDPAWWQFLGPTVFGGVSGIIAWIAATYLRQTLHGQEPCKRWFALAMAWLGSIMVFVAFIAIVGLGSLKGLLGGIYVGTFWGGVFAIGSSRFVWRAFDSPARDYDAEKEKLMNTDLGKLASKQIKKICKFRPDPSFRNTGTLPWVLFTFSIALSMLWTLMFCILTFLTEGAPGVDPVMPIAK